MKADMDELTNGMNDIIEESILCYVLKIPGSYEFISEVLSIINDYDAFDINCLYQSYIATDFSIMDGEVKFEGGKNNRDKVSRKRMNCCTFYNSSFFSISQL